MSRHRFDDDDDSNNVFFIQGNRRRSVVKKCFFFANIAIIITIIDENKTGTIHRHFATCELQIVIFFRVVMNCLLLYFECENS